MIGYYEAYKKMKSWENEVIFACRGADKTRKRPRHINRDTGYSYLINHQKLYPNVKRNEECPCGSGKKFKKCCIDECIKALEGK